MNKYTCRVVDGLIGWTAPSVVLRAKVYCHEYKWLTPIITAHKDVEMEDADATSIHMFCSTKEDSTVAIANVRLTPYEAAPMRGVSSLLTEGAWEIGRLCIDPAYRGKNTGTILTHPFGMLYKVSMDRGIKVWGAVMAPEVLGLLEHYGISFDETQNPVEYHGMRVPVLGAIDNIVSRLIAKRPDVWEALNAVKYNGD